MENNVSPNYRMFEKFRNLAVVRLFRFARALNFVNYFNYNNSKCTSRKNKRKNFFPEGGLSYLHVERALSVVAFFLFVFIVFYISSSIFRIKVFDFIEKVGSGCVVINNQEYYRKRTESYNKNNLSFANRRKSCNCNDDSIKRDKSTPQ